MQSCNQIVPMLFRIDNINPKVKRARNMLHAASGCLDASPTYPRRRRNAVVVPIVLLNQPLPPRLVRRSHTTE
ncbi:uncharacterized protein LY79DRAFT_275718 [Colletotrichum navitas]|uniref:Uncharacterized protein n=1 Tax=Colletotrichum navitas TaxID=681940 RepID=A0AAD8V3Q5_9PEZI|nr:uncharacterized protein LY79DRAFT_275718 [Colletotrichum navitas]KAK1585145.1 hypothetical protein LY79DRAFT_275718 [Colletotrichum navitas]